MNTELHMVLGPMFSGKSSFIINKVNELVVKGVDINNILVINHSIDSRYDIGKICNHNGLKIESKITHELKSILYVNNTVNPDSTIKYIFIDEGQFFNDIYDVIKKYIMTYKYNNVIYICGLDGDYNQLPFGNSNLLSLIPLTNSIIKLNAFCYKCNLIAPFTKRLVNSNETILVGGSDIYQPVCINHL